MRKRLFAALLALVLCLAALPGTSFARETAFLPPLPAAFDFNELTPDTSCIAEINALCDDALEQLRNSNAEAALVYDWNRLKELSPELERQYVLLMIRYYLEPDVYRNTYAAFLADRNAATARILRTQQAILQSDRYGEEFSSNIGPVETDNILNNPASDEQLTGLLDQENELVIRYQKAAQEDPAYWIDGGSWTFRRVREAYQADPGSRETYLRIYNELYARRNEKLGQIYLELTPIRNQIAQYYGYDNYPDYAQSREYHRDYTREETAEFRENVKKYIVPLFRATSLAVECGCFTNGTEYGSLGQEALLDAISPCLAPLSDELAESFTYMRECHLIDADPASAKLQTSFTVTLPGYGTGFVNCYRSGSNADLFDVIHEFGHFNAFTHGSNNSCIDTLEIHSQGLEFLCLDFSDQLFGARANAQHGYEIYKALLSIVKGCMYDELQSYAFTTNGLTLDALNRKSAQLAEEYALTTVGPEGLDYGWIENAHNFSSPMYYISYATSAVSALEFWLLSRIWDQETAADAYLRFVNVSAYFSGYRSTLIASHLDDPFAPDVMEPLSEILAEHVYADLFGVPYEDTADCWAAGDVALLYLLNVLNGTSDTTFSPERTLTRAMAVTALHRAIGCPAPGVNAAAVFSDVPADTWYSDAVGWAIEAGATDGTSETTFSPMKPVTCQEFAAMLYRQRFGADYDYSDEPAPEGAAVWAADAMNWSRDEAVFRGETEPPAPKDELTRAEFAAAIVGAIYD